MTILPVSTYAHLQAWLRREVDPQLAGEMIEAATGALEGELNATFMQREVTERHGGGLVALYLHRAPIVEVDSIADDATTPTEIAATEYFVEHSHLQRRSGAWPLPYGKWNVTYTAGWFATIADVAEDVRLACHRLVAHLLRAPQGPLSSETSGDKTDSYWEPGEALPGDVLQLVRGYARPRL